MEDESNVDIEIPNQGIAENSDEVIEMEDESSVDIEIPNQGITEHSGLNLDIEPIQNLADTADVAATKWSKRPSKRRQSVIADGMYLFLIFFPSKSVSFTVNIIG